MPKFVFFEVEICRLGVQNVKLGKIWPRRFNGLEKDKAGAKIWGLYLKKQRNGATMQLPEDLENTPFNKVPVYEKCKVFTCNHACNLPVIIDSVSCKS